MDQTSHAAAVVVPLAAALGLVGLITPMAMAIRQSTRDAARAQRARMQARPGPESVDATTPAVAGSTIVAQRRDSESVLG